MFDRFAHYLSYGSTDQQTVRDLVPLFDGLLVPGTIAAFQAEATKGFVLSLSAATEVPYAIDSRFPLFQNRLAKPKKSHGMLAQVFGLPELVRSDRQPVPADFPDAVVETASAKWIDFNIGFENVTSATFAKYASRLEEEVFPQDRQDPAFILPPYCMVGSIEDGWWQVSERLYAASLRHGAAKQVLEKLRRVVAATSPAILNSLLSSVQDEQVVVWVSNLEEFRQTSESGLVEYASALRDANARGQRLFALYGGFFSVLLGRYGLDGASHGIGFGEHRDWVELPSSGAPAARYYVPLLHRYIGVDIAVFLWRQFPELVQCDCDECLGRSPASLDYHALMRHSVRVRNAEISEWLDMPTTDAVQVLKKVFGAYQNALQLLEAPLQVRRRAEDIHLHLAMWARVLETVG